MKKWGETKSDKIILKNKEIRWVETRKDDVKLLYMS